MTTVLAWAAIRGAFAMIGFFDFATRFGHFGLLLSEGKLSIRTPDFSSHLWQTEGGAFLFLIGSLGLQLSSKGSSL